MDSTKRIVYYNAFTEDLFFWDNDLLNDSEKVLKINPDSEWIKKIIRDEGLENKINEKFQKYIYQGEGDTSKKIEATFDTTGTEVRFRVLCDNELQDGIKISRGEESIFIWTIFCVYLEHILEQLSLEEEDRTTDDFNQLQCIYVDDPVSSLDDRRIIEVAIDLANLILSCKKEGIKFIISTHHALFFNVMHNELKKKETSTYTLKRYSRQYELGGQENDSPFAYHHMLVDELRLAIRENRLEKYHFNLLRNLLEKTATFLGYSKWGDCILESDINGDLTAEKSHLYVKRIINLNSHSSHSEYESRHITPEEKQMLVYVFNNFMRNFNWKQPDV